MRKTLLSVLAACLATAAVPAAAEERSTVVSYADLDLSDPADVATLERRLADAAKEVCGGLPAGGLLATWTSVETCRTKSLEAAMAKLEALLAPAPREPIALAD